MGDLDEFFVLYTACTSLQIRFYLYLLQMFCSSFMSFMAEYCVYRKIRYLSYPIGSMYGIFAYI